MNFLHFFYPNWNISQIFVLFLLYVDGAMNKFRGGTLINMHNVVFNLSSEAVAVIRITSTLSANARVLVGMNQEGLNTLHHVMQLLPSVKSHAITETAMATNSSTSSTATQHHVKHSTSQVVVVMAIALSHRNNVKGNVESREELMSVVNQWNPDHVINGRHATTSTHHDDSACHSTIVDVKEMEIDLQHRRSVSHFASGTKNHLQMTKVCCEVTLICYYFRILSDLLSLLRATEFIDCVLFP